MNKTLLGKDSDGVKYYLADPSWDCDWYWGYGYIQSKDSHQHADGEFKTGDKSYDTDIFTGNFLVEKTFTDKQGWQLRELMATFYQLKNQAELVGRGGMHVTTNPLKDMLLDEGYAKQINQIQIPAITKAIKAILDEGKK
jgi:hypothetical protein